MNSSQIRAARALLGWKQRDLSVASGLSIETIKRLEKMEGKLTQVTGTTINAIEEALEAGGVRFLENGDVAKGPGVALRK